MHIPALSERQHPKINRKTGLDLADVPSSRLNLSLSPVGNAPLDLHRPRSPRCQNRAPGSSRPALGSPLHPGPPAGTGTQPVPHRHGSIARDRAALRDAAFPGFPWERPGFALTPAAWEPPSPALAPHLPPTLWGYLQTALSSFCTHLCCGSSKLTEIPVPTQYRCQFWRIWLHRCAPP